MTNATSLFTETGGACQSKENATSWYQAGKCGFVMENWAPKLCRRGFESALPLNMYGICEIFIDKRNKRGREW